MIFLGDDLMIGLTVNESLVGSTVKVYLKRSTDAEGIEKVATSINTTTNTIYYEITATNNTVAGATRIWAEITNSSGKKATTTVFEFTISERGKL